MIGGKQKVREKMAEIKNLGNEATKKDENMYPILEIVLEMYERGYNFLPIDLYKSDAMKFKIEDNAIRPPLNSIAGMGQIAAQGIQEARQKGEFISKADIKKRAKGGDAVIAVLEKFGGVEGMSETNQMSLFDTMM